MKLNIIRQSGKTIDLKQHEYMVDESRAMFDAKEKEIGELDKENEAEWTEFFELQREMFKKYHIQIQVNLPTTDYEWLGLMERFEGSPIIIGRDAEEVVHLMIMDHIPPQE